MEPRFALRLDAAPAAHIARNRRRASIPAGATAGGCDGAGRGGAGRGGNGLIVKFVLAPTKQKPPTDSQIFCNWTFCGVLADKPKRRRCDQFRRPSSGKCLEPPTEQALKPNHVTNDGRQMGKRCINDRIGNRFQIFRLPSV